MGNLLYQNGIWENICKTKRFPAFNSLDLQSVYSEELDRQIFIPIGCYKGNTVAIKKVLAPINLNRALMMELKAMKDIQHDHLVRFYGAAIDEVSVPCLLTEYCPKGSLQDILENSEINLDWMFKLSLMHDIVKVSIKFVFERRKLMQFEFHSGHALSAHNSNTLAWPTKVVKLRRRFAVRAENHRLWPARVEAEPDRGVGEQREPRILEKYDLFSNAFSAKININFP